MQKAYSYLRFSTPEQASGDSFRRQTRLAEDYAARRGLELDRTLTFQDLGVSAYRGLNAAEGRLADFREAVTVGLVPPGSFLLVESLDRLSRQSARKAMRVLEQIVEAGVTVVTLTDEKAYTEKGLDEDPMSLLMALLTFIRANEESATKGRRLRAAWSSKRANAASRPLTAKCPSWLRLDPATGRFEVLEDRAAVVRRIFEEAAAGVGLQGITTGLNKDGIAPFGTPNRSTRTFWGRSTVVKIVDSPAAGGIFVPHSLDYTGGRKRRVPQDPVPGYFPAVVPEDVFQTVQAQRSGRDAPRTRTAHGVRNLLAGLAVCPSCGLSMTRVNKGDGGKAGRPRLTCVGAKARRCAAPSAVLEEVEEALRSHAETLVSEAPRGSDDMLDAVATAEAALEGTDALVSRALDALIANPTSGALKDRLEALEEQRAGERATLKGLQERAKASAGPLVERRLERVRDALGNATATPAEVNAALREALSEVVVDAAEGRATLRWRHGGTSDLAFSWGVRPEG